MRARVHPLTVPASGWHGNGVLRPCNRVCTVSGAYALYTHNGLTSQTASIVGAVYRQVQRVVGSRNEDSSPE